MALDPEELFASDNTKPVGNDPEELFAQDTAAPNDPEELFNESKFSQDRFSDDQLAAEQTRQSTGVRKQFDDPSQFDATPPSAPIHFDPVGTISEHEVEARKNVGPVVDSIVGASQGVQSFIPFTDRTDQPAYGQPGVLPFISNTLSGIGRNAAAFAAGSAVGGPFGGAAAVTTDRASQIENENPGGLVGSFSRSPWATITDLALSGVSSLTSPGAKDLAAGFGQGFSQSVEEGADLGTLEGWKEAGKQGLMNSVLPLGIMGIKAAKSRLIPSTKPTIDTGPKLLTYDPDRTDIGTPRERASVYGQRAEGIKKLAVEAELAGKADSAKSLFNEYRKTKFQESRLMDQQSDAEIDVANKLSTAERNARPVTDEPDILPTYRDSNQENRLFTPQSRDVYIDTSQPKRPLFNQRNTTKEAKDLTAHGMYDFQNEPRVVNYGEPIFASPSERMIDYNREQANGTVPGMRKPKFGLSNKVFTEEAYTAAKKRYNSKLGQMQSGIDPSTLKDLAVMGGYYVEGGMRDFAKWSNQMVKDFGDHVKPHLDKIWADIHSSNAKGKEQNVKPSSESQGQASRPEVNPLNNNSVEGAGDQLSSGVAPGLNIKDQGNTVQPPQKFYSQSIVDNEDLGIPAEAGMHKFSYMKNASPEAAEQIINDINVGKKSLFTQRRGKITDKQMVQKAAEENMTMDKIRKIKPGQVVPPEKVQAILGSGEMVSAKANELQTKLDKEFDHKTFNELQQANYDRFDILRVATGQGTEAARTLRLFGQTLGHEGLNYDSTGTPKFDGAFRDKAAKTLQKHVFKDEPVPKSIIDEFTNAKTPEDVAKILTREAKLRLKTSPWEAAANTIKAGLLTGVKTQARNLGSQIAKGSMMQVENSVSGMVDWALSNRTKQRTAVGPGTGTGYDLVKGLKQGAKEGWQLIRGKATPEVEKVLNRLDLSVGQNTGIKAMDAYVNTIFRIQGAADMPWRRAHWINSIRQQAEIQAKNEVLQGTLKKAEVGKRTSQLMEAPTQEMAHNATVYAEEATYAQKNDLADIASSAIKKISTKGKAGKAAAFTLEVGVLPFKKTPFNIATDMIVHTIAPARLGYDIATAKTFRKVWDNSLSKEEQKAFSKLVGQSTTGAGAYWLGYMLASKGLMTGSSQDESSGQKGRDEAFGRNSGAIKLGGKWHRISDALSPVSNLMTVGATLYRDLTKPMEDETDRTGALIGDVFKTVTDTPYFEGIERLGDIKKQNGIQRVAGGMASAVVPTLASDVAGLFDDKRRETRPQPGDSFSAGIAKQVSSRIPGLRNTLPPRVNSLGDTEPEAWSNAINPAFSKDAVEDTDPVARELIANSISMAPPKRKLMESEEAFQKRAKQRGDAIMKAARTVTSRKDYMSATPERKRELLKDAVGSAL